LVGNRRLEGGAKLVVGSITDELRFHAIPENRGGWCRVTAGYIPIRKGNNVYPSKRVISRLGAEGKGTRRGAKPRIERTPYRNSAAVGFVSQETPETSPGGEVPVPLRVEIVFCVLLMPPVVR
jgi:hypothetical protein